MGLSLKIETALHTNELYKQQHKFKALNNESNNHNNAEL